MFHEAIKRLTVRSHNHQVLLLSDEGLVRDVTRFGAQGREEAMDCLRQLEVVNFGWSKEAWRAYDLEPDIHQIGLVAQQARRCFFLQKLNEKKSTRFLRHGGRTLTE